MAAELDPETIQFEDYLHVEGVKAVDPRLPVFKTDGVRTKNLKLIQAHMEKLVEEAKQEEERQRLVAQRREEEVKIVEQVSTLPEWKKKLVTARLMAKLDGDLPLPPGYSTSASTQQQTAESAPGASSPATKTLPAWKQRRLEREAAKAAKRSTNAPSNVPRYMPVSESTITSQRQVKNTDGVDQGTEEEAPVKGNAEPSATKSNEESGDSQSDKQEPNKVTPKNNTPAVETSSIEQNESVLSDNAEREIKQEMQSQPSPPDTTSTINTEEPEVVGKSDGKVVNGDMESCPQESEESKVDGKPASAPAEENKPEEVSKMETTEAVNTLETESPTSGAPDPEAPGSESVTVNEPSVKNKVEEDGNTHQQSLKDAEKENPLAGYVAESATEDLKTKDNETKEKLNDTTCDTKQGETKSAGSTSTETPKVVDTPDSKSSGMETLTSVVSPEMEASLTQEATVPSQQSPQAEAPIDSKEVNSQPPVEPMQRIEAPKIQHPAIEKADASQQAEVSTQANKSNEADESKEAQVAEIPKQADSPPDVNAQEDAKVPKDGEILQSTKTSTTENTKAVKEVETPQEEEPAKSEGIPKEAQPLKSAEIPKEAEPPKSAETSIKAEPPKSAEISKEAEPPTSAEIPEQDGTPQSSEKPKEVEVSKSADTSKTVDAPKDIKDDKTPAGNEAKENDNTLKEAEASKK